MRMPSCALEHSNIFAILPEAADGLDGNLPQCGGLVRNILK